MNCTGQNVAYILKSFAFGFWNIYGHVCIDCTPGVQAFERSMQGPT